jgi:hypothetical protein
MVKCVEVMDGLFHERMTLGGNDEVVGDTHGNRFGEDDGIHKEGIYGTKTTYV